MLGEDGAPFLDSAKNKAYVIDGKSWVNNHAHVLRSLRGIVTAGFLCHYLNQFDYRNYVTGTTRLKLNQFQMKKIPILIPPLAEQHRIVSKIEELFTKLDAGVEALKKTKVQLKRYRQAVLKTAFEGKLTKEWREAQEVELEPALVLLERIRAERKNDINNKTSASTSLQTPTLSEIPDGWVWTKLGCLGEFINGRAFKPSEWCDKGRPIIRIQNLTGSTNELHYFDAPVEEKYLVRSGDLLISWSATLDAFVWMGQEAVVNQHIFKVTSFVDKMFLYHLVKAFLQRLKAQVHGSGMQHITKGPFLNTSVPLPPLLEQRKIVEEIEFRTSIVNQIETTIDLNLKAGERLRMSILKKAFEGKLVPQDPNDEPANMLLGRISEEKSKRAVEERSRKKWRNNLKQTRLM